MFIDIALLLNHLEDERNIPTPFSQVCRKPAGQDSRNVIQQPAPGDVRQPLYSGKQCPQLLVVTAMRLEQLLTQGAPKVGIENAEGGALDIEYFPHQRITVCMQSARWQPDDDVTGPDRLAVDDLALFHHSHNEAHQVIVAFSVQPGHLGGLTPDEGAIYLLASLCQSFDDVAHLFRKESAHPDVIQKK
ncbi:MAG: hypothetical protein DDT26_01853 [Dehalococcoidia bacterium]|nr:hypothetical protein [Chloroflexota bacterium]